MISSRTRERWNTKTIIMITVLVSVALIATSFLYSPQLSDWKNIQISVACSILASNVIMYLTSEYMLRSKRRVELIDKWGVESLYKTRAEMNAPINAALADCKKTIDIVAFGLRSFRETKNEEVDDLLSSGVKIRILTLDPDSKMAGFVDEREDALQGVTKQSIEDLIKWVGEKEKSGSIEIKKYDFLPLDFYFRIDDRVYVGPYLKYYSSQQTISYEFSFGEGFLYWSKYFDKVWERLG